MFKIFVSVTTLAMAFFMSGCQSTSATNNVSLVHGVDESAGGLPAYIVTISNVVHKQDGDYFHALNSGTEKSTSVVAIESDQHVRIIFTSASTEKHLIAEEFSGGLPAPEWIAFGDEQSPRMLYLLNHQDDNQPDDYVSRPYMTVFGFGRSGKEKFLSTPKTFSIGFVESTDYQALKRAINVIANR